MADDTLSDNTRNAAKQRFQKAYDAANRLNGLGIAVQWFSIFDFLAALVIAATDQLTVPVRIMGTCNMIVAGFVLLALGFWIRARSEGVRNSTDATVCASPFLTRTDMAALMGLPYAAAAGVKVPPKGPVTLSQGEWRCKCGAINEESATLCAQCKRSRGAVF